MKTLISVVLLMLTGCSSIGVCANFEECRQRGLENRMTYSGTSVHTIDTGRTAYILTTRNIDGVANTRITTVGKR